ncbi:MAG: hypothetical protein Q9169_008693 [Polycauliona sp. 2 TL-2023]
MLASSRSLQTSVRREKERRARVLEIGVANFFFKVLDAVFVTTNSVASKALTEGFEPDIYIIDEAGTDTMPSLLCPLAHYMNKLKAVVLARDVKQLGPILDSKGFSAFINRIVYNGQLEDADNVKTPTAKGITVREFFKTTFSPT